MVKAPYMVSTQYQRFSDRYPCFFRCPAQIPDGLLGQIEELMLTAGNKGIFFIVQSQRHIYLRGKTQ